MDSHNAIAAVVLRNDFYRRLHFLALGLFALMLIVTGLLLSLLMYIAKNPSPPLYFATDTVGRLINITPVDRQNMSIDDLNAWLVEAVESAYSYDYLNFRSELQGSQKYFTNYGWTKYMDALKASNNLNGVIERKWIALAKVIETPKIEEEGTLGGAYGWRFKVRVLVSYLIPPQYDAATMRVDPLELTILVKREPILQSYKGVGIVQIVGKVINTDTYNQTQQISNTPQS